MTKTRTASSMIALLLMAAGASAAGCGTETQRAGAPAQEPAATAPASTGATGGETAEAGPAQAVALRPRGERGLRVPAERARIVARESDYGRVLFDANDQVVYAFENDRANRSNCTSDDCVEAWPPVLTLEQPTAGAGVKPRLLGTIRRTDGTVQVTYNGRPLYFYAHEERGEIRCHNVDLHGGLWWVLTPRGQPAD